MNDVAAVRYFAFLREVLNVWCGVVLWTYFPHR